jgi:ubiquinone/menaquinone biosynthesis C-methylase UbiE
MTTFSENVSKLRRAERLQELEVDRVVRLCLEHGCRGSLLDIGTGSGLFAEAFDGCGLDVYGIDPDPDMIAAARYYLPGAGFQVAAAESLPFRDNVFDAVFMGMVLHETADPQRAMREARRVVRTLVIILEWPFPKSSDPKPKARRFRPAEIRRWSESVGFTAMQTHRLAHMILYINRLR